MGSRARRRRRRALSSPSRRIRTIEVCVSFFGWKSSRAMSTTARICVLLQHPVAHVAERRVVEDAVGDDHRHPPGARLEELHAALDEEDLRRLRLLAAPARRSSSMRIVQRPSAPLSQTAASSYWPRISLVVDDDVRAERRVRARATSMEPSATALRASARPRCAGSQGCWPGTARPSRRCS